MGQELKQLDETDVGSRMHQCMTDLFPLHRSMTGDGVRETLGYLQQFLPIDIHEVSTGTKVFDWRIPQEWKVRDAYIADSQGNRIVDYQRSNLQVISGSQPVRGQFTFPELQPHLEFLPEELNPDWIPYRTAFFRDAWGFCISQRQLRRLTENVDEPFLVCVDSEFLDGSLTYGEATIAGESDETLLIYAHCCHPSLASDNLSGLAVAACLGQRIMERVALGDVPLKTYKFVFAPATIGAITWLARNQHCLSRIYGGLILSLLGDAGNFTYKQSRQAHAPVDRAAAYVLSRLAAGFRERPFTPFGYDERQFCSPGINLPIGCLMRTPNGEFPEYHTSGDNLEFVSAESLAQSWHVVTALLAMLEQNEIGINRNPCCEPQLGNRGLYRAFGQHDDRGRFQEAVLWVLNLSDGQHDLLSVAERSGLPFGLVREAFNTLCEHDLLHGKS